MTTPARRPSMADVAARAGVSYQTVSRVLNEPEIVRPETRSRVEEGIAALGYTRNRAARALKTTRSSLIGVLTDGSSLFGPAETTTAIETAAREAGYSVLLTTVGAGDAEDRSVGAELVGSGADGILVVAAHEAMVPAVAAVARHTPVLAVSAQAPRVPDVRVVGVDQQLGAMQIVEHLAGTGARSVVHAAGPADWFDARARRDGFDLALEQHDLDGEIVGPGDWTPRSGYDLTTALIARGLPDAIFAANDMMAIGVLHALHEHRLRVPEDVAVVGFDNTLGAEFLIPSLTTVSQPFAELGRVALGRLLDLLDGEDVPAGTPCTLPPRLVVRRSTGAERTH
ncbi:LacI family DNA-binding transcriptional regulator [Brachybacterium sp. GCM10030267]|uniref:LacI family DNA-binding transcriptional regulator n=1 Tax=Brachybacterium sp. GCM10030267 TaxID=3273381 RepID=UPI003611CF51